MRKEEKDRPQKKAVKHKMREERVGNICRRKKDSLKLVKKRLKWGKSKMILIKNKMNLNLILIILVKSHR